MLLELIELFRNGWKIIFTDLVPYNLDGFTNCTNQTITLRTWEILGHEVHHAAVDCLTNSTGVIIDYLTKY